MIVFQHRLTKSADNFFAKQQEHKNYQNETKFTTKKVVFTITATLHITGISGSVWNSMAVSTLISFILQYKVIRIRHDI